MQRLYIAVCTLSLHRTQQVLKQPFGAVLAQCNAHCQGISPQYFAQLHQHKPVCCILAGKGRKQSLIAQSIPNNHQRAYVQQGSPDFSGLDLTLQQQWDVAANAHLGDVVIKPQSKKEVWWLCDQCPDGYLHSWSAAVYSRSNGNGCPQCRGRKVCRHNSLATKAPGVAAQWDFEANDGQPDTVVMQSNQHAHWLCDACGHKWSARIMTRVMQKTGCPECAKVRKWTKRPTFAGHPLLAEWDHIRNSKLEHYPDSTTLQSNKQIFWLCHNCPAGQQHSWSARPCERTGRSKSGCPFCAGKRACRCNSLQALYPDTAAEWDYCKNQGQPSDYPAGSGYIAWWISPQRGSWQQTIHRRTNAVRQRTARLRHAERQRWLPNGGSQADC